MPERDTEVLEFARLTLKLLLADAKTVAALEESSNPPVLLSFPMQIGTASSRPGSTYKNNLFAIFNCSDTRLRFSPCTAPTRTAE